MATSFCKFFLIAGVLAQTAVLSSLASAAEEPQIIENGEYGQLSAHKHWALTLWSPEWGQTWQFKLDLNPDGVFVHDIGGTTADGANERLPGKFTARTTRIDDSTIQFVLGIPKLPHPRPGKPGRPPGRSQFVWIELVNDGERVFARALPSDLISCPQCATWTVTEHSQR